MLYELLYTSVASTALTPEQQVALLEQAHSTNQKIGITGLLVYHRREFMQILEGEEAVVKALYAKICQDDRHTSVNTFWEGTIAERSFSGWSMGFVNIADIDVQTLEGYSDLLNEGLSSVHLKGTESIGRNLLVSLIEQIMD